MLLKESLNFGYDEMSLIALFAHNRRVLQLLLFIAIKRCFSRRSRWVRDGGQYHASYTTTISCCWGGAAATVAAAAAQQQQQQQRGGGS
jgi:hypothetical protein